jgi:heterodisulfide reductase subunit A-like polyferredoxin/coenzyme F420-reducing hydrogenase delta subunit
MSENKDTALFICDCGGTISQSIDLGKVEDKFKETTEVCRHSALCSPDGRLFITDSLEKSGCERAVIAACSPTMFQQEFKQAANKAAVNECMISRANIREQCAWTTPKKSKATKAAVSIIEDSLKRCSLQEQFKPLREKPVKKALVIGGGVAGMKAAKLLAESGIPVALVEKEAQLGGNSAKLGYVYQQGRNGDSPGHVAQSLIDYVQAESKIELMLESGLVSLQGQVGNFSASINTPKGKVSQIIGAIIVAAGYQSSYPLEKLGLDRTTALLSLMELGPILAAGKLRREKCRRVAFVLDMFHQDSRLICAGALRSAIMFREKYNNEVYFICKSVRVNAEGLEILYQKARDAGVVVVKFDENPKIISDGLNTQIEVNDAWSGGPIVIQSDLTVFGDLLTPNSSVDGLKQILNVDLGPQSFFQDDNVWLSPVMSNRRGIYFAGGCRAERDIPESMLDAESAVQEIGRIFSGKDDFGAAEKAVIDTDKCILCLTCIRSCPHKAIDIDYNTEAAVVTERACWGCGVCSAECPAKAIQHRNFTDDEILAETENPGRIVAFCCVNSAYKAADLVGTLRMELPCEVKIVPVPCAGKIDTLYILKEFERWAEGVMLLFCHEDTCQYISGSTRAAQRSEYAKSIMQQIGLEPERLLIGRMTAMDKDKFVEQVQQMKSILENLGKKDKALKS